MSLPPVSTIQTGRVQWPIGHFNGARTLSGARGVVRFEASAVAVQLDDVTILPDPVETSVVAGVMVPVDLLRNDPEVWNWKVTPILGVPWQPFHIDVPGDVDLSQAAVVPGIGPTRVVKGPPGDPGADGERGPEGPYGGTSVTDPQVASYLTSDTATRAAVKAYVDELLPRFDVRDYGAVGDGVTDDTAAINAALAAAQGDGGGVVVLPDARTWLVQGALRLDGINSQRVIIDGQDSLILTWGSSSTDPVLWVGNSGATSETNNARRVSIRDLRIQAHANWNSDTVQERRGLVLDVVQDAWIENVWISGYSGGNLVCYDLFDSVFVNVQLLKSTSSEHHALQLRGRFDQSNANHFFGLHIEGVALAIGIYDDSRHNQFVASKIETGTFANSGTTSPVHLDGLENAFLGLHISKNLTDAVPVIYSPDRDVTSTAEILNLPMPMTRFTGCMFTSQLSGMARWVKGSFLRFENCDFGRGQGLADFSTIELRYNAHLHNCDIQMRPGHSGVITLAGTHCTVRDVTLRLSTNAATGTQLLLKAGAANNLVENFKIYGAGAPQVRVGSELAGTGWGSNVIHLHPGYTESRTAATTIGDVRSEVIRITGGSDAVQTITPRHDGARLTVVNTGSGQLRFATSGNVRGVAYPDDRFVPAGAAAAFTCLAGIWYEA